MTSNKDFNKYFTDEDIAHWMSLQTDYAAQIPTDKWGNNIVIASRQYLPNRVNLVDSSVANIALLDVDKGKVLGSSHADIFIALADGIIAKGGDGDDVMLGASTRSRLYGEDGNDVLKSGDGRHYLYGGKGNDCLFSEGGTQVLQGGDGKDMISATRGEVTIGGGNGEDSIALSGAIKARLRGNEKLGEDYADNFNIDVAQGAEITIEDFGEKDTLTFQFHENVLGLSAQELLAKAGLQLQQEDTYGRSHDIAPRRLAISGDALSGEVTMKLHENAPNLLAYQWQENQVEGCMEAYKDELHRISDAYHNGDYAVVFDSQSDIENGVLNNIKLAQQAASVCITNARER